MCLPLRVRCTRNWELATLTRRYLRVHYLETYLEEEILLAVRLQLCGQGHERTGGDNALAQMQNKLTHSQPDTHSTVEAHPAGTKAKKTGQSCQTSGSKPIVNEGLRRSKLNERRRGGGKETPGAVSYYPLPPEGQVKERNM